MLKNMLSQKLLALVVVVCGAAFLAVALNESTSQGQAKKEDKKVDPQPPQVRYFATTPESIEATAPANSTDKMTDGLNALAAGGWVLVGIDAGNKDRSGYYVFQRGR